MKSDKNPLEPDIYEDEANLVMFFNLKAYMKAFVNDVMKQDNNKEYSIVRKLCIHQVSKENVEKVVEMIANNSKPKHIFKITIQRHKSSCTEINTFYSVRKPKELEYNEEWDWDTVIVEKYEIRYSSKPELW